MTFDQYDEAAALTARYPRLHPVAPVYPALGLAGEAGEVAEKVKKMLRDRGTEPLTDAEREQVLREAGDVLWYLSALARDLGSNLETVARLNVDKLAARQARGTLHGSGDDR